ncbi:ABC transporter permease [Varibaculum massiliense]|uniref:ABC transporter permease n=1 Tax=Varibaculum massiliense TaxID=1852372 RepID=UPI00288BE79E|nr:ABC transporter permease subunit [Varibaculum massiliense]
MRKVLVGCSSWLVILGFCALAAIWPLAFVIRAAIVSPFGGEEAIASALRLSLLEAVGSAILATIWGSAAALGARVLPGRIRQVVEMLCLCPIAIPPFIVASALRSFAGSSASNLTGPLPVIAVFSFSLAPLAYFSARSTLKTIRRDQLDQARILGLGHWDIFRLIIARPLFASIPLSLGVTFALAFSDPLVPDLVGGKTMNAAHSLWLRATGSFETAFLGHASLVLTGLSLCAAGILIALYFTTYRNFFPATLLGASNFPLGSPRPLPLLGVGSYALSSAGLILYLLFHASFSASKLQSVINTWLLSALAAFLCLVVLAATRRLGATSRYMTIEALFIVILSLPGAAIGAGWMLLRQQGMSWPFSSGGFLSLCSFLLIGMPVTYFLAARFRAVGPAEFEAVRVLGVGRMQTALKILLPAVKRYFSLTLATVVAISTTLSAPLMWVAAPDTPVVVPQMFAMVDEANYAEAFGLSLAALVVSITLFVLVPKEEGKWNRPR